MDTIIIMLQLETKNDFPNETVMLHVFMMMIIIMLRTQLCSHKCTHQPAAVLL